MKKAILDYILRSPAERKRLHILMIPREVPTSSCKIALKGGYSTRIFKEWHVAKKNATDDIKIRMICNNIVMASLTNWWYDFRDLRLIKFDGIKAFAESIGFELTYGKFLDIAYLFKDKTLALLKDVWFRGAIMIIKRFKYLKSRGLLPGKWTYAGKYKI